MKIAFYAPLKPVDHPVPSGDRQLGQALREALRVAGHDPVVASQFRSFEGRGDARRQARLADVGKRLADRLVRRLSSPERRPALWFTYHLYHKAPDFLGPAVSGALDIPYVVAEASVAAKQRHGKWALGYWESVTAIESASAAIFLNPADLSGVRAVRGTARDDEYIPPFLDLAAFAAPSVTPSAAMGDRKGRVRLIAVAMMRPGAKLASYRLLADALALVATSEWELVLVGDGSARPDVEAAFARFDPAQIRLVGFQDAQAVSSWLRSSDVYVWPAIDEAFGMAFIEAQACGLPVIAGNSGGVASVVAANRTGLLVPPGDAVAFAGAIQSMVTREDLRRRMAAEALEYVTAQHDLPAASARIDAVLRRAVAEHASSARAKAAPATAR